MQHLRYCKIKVVGPAIFASELHLKSVYTMSSDSVDIYTDQLYQSIPDAVDEFVPLKTWTQHCGKCPHCWFADVAVKGKNEGCRLEQRWTMTRYKTDHVPYRAVRHHTNFEINRSRHLFIRVCCRSIFLFSSCCQMEPAEARCLGGQFSHSFVDKLEAWVHCHIYKGTFGN